MTTIPHPQPAQLVHAEQEHELRSHDPEQLACSLILAAQCDVLFFAGIMCRYCGHAANHGHATTCPLPDQTETHDRSTSPCPADSATRCPKPQPTPSKPSPASPSPPTSWEPSPRPAAYCAAGRAVGPPPDPTSQGWRPRGEPPARPPSRRRRTLLSKPAARGVP